MSRYQNWFCAAALAALGCFSPGTTFAQYTVTTLTTSGAEADGVGVAVDAHGNLYLTGTYPPPAPLPAPSTLFSRCPQAAVRRLVELSDH